MFRTLGVTPGQLVHIAALIRQAHPELDIAPRSRGWHEGLSFLRRVYLTICYLRLNVTQEALAVFFNTSQPTASRIISTLTVAVAEALAPYVPTGDDLDPGEQLIIDGTLLPTWSWRDQDDLWSGKHHRTGVNVQVAVDLDGNLVWVGDPMPGATHDAKAIQASGVLQARPKDANFQYIGDKGYQGLGMLTPDKKPRGGQLRPDQKEANSVLNGVRAVVERAIGNIKAWRILHTDYRRPYHTFVDTISAVVGINFFTAACQ